MYGGCITVFDALVAVLVGGSHGQKGRESNKSIQGFYDFLELGIRKLGI